MKTVSDIREEFRNTDPDSRGMLEIIAAQFVADEPAIFGTPNHDWHRRELEWYNSQSLNVNDIPEPIPAIWKKVSSAEGKINSNYGWCIFSAENGYQYRNVVATLKADIYSRQAVMIYTRPDMHSAATVDGMYDFICTNTVQVFVRGGALWYIVNMRSSDAVFGYKGDLAWHTWVQKSLLKDTALIGISLGPIIWNAGSLHVYPEQDHLVFKGDS